MIQDACDVCICLLRGYSAPMANTFSADRRINVMHCLFQGHLRLSLYGR